MKQVSTEKKIEEGNSIEDLMFLLGWKSNVRFGEVEMVKVRAEQDWYDGKNSNANPYNEKDRRHKIWHEQWIECNKNL